MTLLSEQPVCQLSGKNWVQYKIKGFVHITNADNLDIPENFVETLSMGSLRVVDLTTSKYMEVPFSYKPSVDQYGVKYSKVGYFEFNMWGAHEYHLRFFVVAPKGTTPISTPWTPCSDATCSPEVWIDGFMPKVLVKTASGDLDTSFPPDAAVPICQVGGNGFDWPNITVD